MFLTPPGMVSSRHFWRQFGVGQVPARYGSARVFLFLWTPCPYHATFAAMYETW